ncbi:MAG: hypothetical protein EPO24_01675 [Bacteroidetes bacterium]|nr:MAG: hypothetical protein EPO24_01675 [Bacteroidota bacterium]
MKKYFVLLMIIVIAFVGCGKKETPPVPVGEMPEYKDPAFGFKIHYPQEWKQLGTTGKAVFVKSQEVANKFIDPQSGEEGAQVIVEVLKLEGKTHEEVINTSKEAFKQSWAKVDIQPDQQLTIGGKQGTKVAYSVPVTAKTNIMGYEIYVAGDTAVYKLDFMGYGDQYNAHAAVFDAMLKSFELPVVIIKSDKWVASPSMESYTSTFFTMQYPENLIPENVSKGKFDFAMKMRADRLDCSIQIDVFGAQKLTVEKVFEQNKGKVRARSTGKATVDGQNALWVEDQAAANIMRRQYFVVKNDKVIRPTIVWYVPDKDIYLPVFEKMVTSIKLK